LNGTVAAQGEKRGRDTPSNPRRLTIDPCNKVGKRANADHASVGPGIDYPAGSTVFDFLLVIEVSDIADGFEEVACLVRDVLEERRVSWVELLGFPFINGS